MNSFQLIKSERFGEIQADIYSNGKDMFMTANQLCNCLGENRKAFDMRIARNPRLKTADFSVSHKLLGTDGKMYNTRIFNEDGIYEITLLSESEVGAEFRHWVRKLLKSLRSGQAILISTTQLEKMRVEASQQRARAMLLNAQNRALKTIMATIGDKQLSPIAVEVFGLTAIEQITGKEISYRPACEKTYTATDLANEFGTNKNQIGKIATAAGMKTDEYGITVLDKSPYSSKEVPSFRYNEKGRAKLKGLVQGARS